MIKRGRGRKEIEGQYDAEFGRYLRFVEGVRKKAAAKIKNAGKREKFLRSLGSAETISMLRDKGIEAVSEEILRALDIRHRGPELISCPTCGRCEVNLFNLADEVEHHIQTMEKPLKIAVMGCVVNGPGEAKEADIGVAGGKGVGIIFKKGKLYKKVAENELLDVFIKELDSMSGEKK